MNRLAVAVLGLLLSTALAAQEITESRAWTERFPVSGPEPRLKISNIWGTVRVRPGPAGQITIAVDERRSAPDQERFDRSLQLLNTDIGAAADSVEIIVGEPTRNWRRTDPCRGCRVDYQFDVTVPEGTRLELGTVLDGAIDVSGVTGTVSASNVNGPIKVYQARNCGSLESVNGAMDVRFDQAPAANCDIETINGDISLVLPGRERAGRSPRPIQRPHGLGVPTSIPLRCLRSSNALATMTDSGIAFSNPQVCASTGAGRHFQYRRSTAT